MAATSGGGPAPERPPGRNQRLLFLRTFSATDEIVSPRGDSREPSACGRLRVNISQRAMRIRRNNEAGIV